MQILSIETKAAKFFDRMAEGDLLTIADFGFQTLKCDYSLSDPL